MRHPASKSLSKDEVTKIYNLTREIMKKENIADITLEIKPKVWRTCYTWVTKKIDRTRFSIIEYIQLGGYMLTGFKYPYRTYYISLYDPEHRIFTITDRNVMLATIVASGILEEIAHAIKCRNTNWTVGVKSHGPEFLLVFRELWSKYFISFQYALQNIYGSEGYLGEELL